MINSRPIIFIEDDMDDQELFKEILLDLAIPNIIRFFDNCLKAFDYLVTSIEKPLVIISDINLPGMTGLEFREMINKNDELRKKSTPFVFLSTNPDKTLISKAYELLIQGYFVKPTKLEELKEILGRIIGYWKFCHFPER